MAAAGIIAAPDDETLDQMSTSLLFHTVLQHSKSFNDRLPAFLNTSPDFNTPAEFHKRFNRFIAFNQKVRTNPPVKEHLELLKSVHALWYPTAPQSDSKVAATIQTIQQHVQTYLRKLYTIAIAVTADSASYQKYFKLSTRFYMSKLDSNYDDDFMENATFKAHQEHLDGLYWYMNESTGTGKVNEAITSFVLSETLYNAEYHSNDEYLFPLVSNFIPPRVREDFAKKSAHVKRVLDRRTQEGEALQESDPRPLSQYDPLMVEHEFTKIVTDKTPPETLFPEGFFDNPDRLPPRPPRNERRRREPGESPEPPPTEPPTGPLPRHPPPPPPPATPPIPDDTSVTYDPSLYAKARDFIKDYQALPATVMTRDHMTFFKVSDERQTPISKSSMPLKFAPDVRSGKNRFSQGYYITFTRMSRKPIFNPVD
jgi:hypothetical protein